jgi:hypothetical protein
MNASSTRRSESISYVHAVSQMAVDARGTPTICELMKCKRPACAE